MRVSPGRRVAARALLDVEEGRHLDRGLERRAPEDPTDRALAWHLAFGVTRRRGALDKLVHQLAKRPVHTLDPEVLTALRVGLYELHFSRTPDHAAVDQAVRLCIALRAGRAKGFVNAILRRSQGRRLDDRLTVNHPRWLVDRWRDRYGLHETSAWCRDNDSEPPLALALHPDRPVELEGAVGRAAGREVPGTLVVAGGSPTRLPGFDEGAFWVMDPAAGATADLLEVRPGEEVLDACAAPGGKTLRLATAGARVLATDRDGQRLDRLRENLDRVGVDVELARVVWGEEQGPDRSFDAALVDAPCTGLGTLRRHPEIRWLRRATDPAGMALIQAPILEAVAERVRPGGRLVYAVCSAEPEEGRDVVEAFLEDVPGWTLDTVLETAPPKDGEDAFYAARLSRAP